MLLSEFPIVVEFRPGRTNAVADCLSRLPAESANESPAPAVDTVLDGLILLRSDRVTDPDLSPLISLLGEIPWSRDDKGVLHLDGKLPAEFVLRVWSLPRAPLGWTRWPASLSAKGPVSCCLAGDDCGP